MSESAKIFVSCAPADDGFVERLGRDLSARGFPVVLHPEVSSFSPAVRQLIETSDRVLAVVDSGSVESPQVRAEWEHALLFGKSVLLLLRNTNGFPPELARLQYLDFLPTRPYEEAFAQLVELLEAPPLRLGALHDVPSLPVHFAPRREELLTLGAKVMGPVRKPTELTSPRDPVALTGLPGVGKSVLAAVLARSADARRAFFDGIVWLTVGRTPNLSEKAERLGVALGDDPMRYAELEAGRARLVELLADKACLIILDDVHDLAPVESFLNVLGGNCRLLFTTSEAGLGPALPVVRAQLFPMEPVAPDRGLELLSSWSGIEAPLPTSAATLAEACGSLPFSLALAGAMVREGVGWNEMAAAIGRVAPSGPDPLRTLKLAVEVMARQDVQGAQRFHELAVFPDAETIPEAAIHTLWSDPKRSTDLLTRLEGRGLLRLDGEPPARRIALHEVQQEYLRGAVQKPVALHAKLLSAYRSRCPAGWASGPKDGYFFERLTHHLKEAGGALDQKKLLTNVDWLEAKLRATDVKSLLSDFEGVETLAERLVAHAIRLSAFVLWRDPDQLASQLSGRLMKLDAPEIRDLLRAVVEKKRGAWLRPLTPSLTPPGGPLRRTLTGHLGWVTSVAVTPDGERAVSASSDQTLKLWDLQDGIELQTLTAHSGWVCSVVVTADGRRAVTALVDRCLKVWDLVTGLELTTLEGHGDWVTSVGVTPDGKRAVSASWDKTLKVWDLESFREIQTLTGHTGGVTAVAVAPDGRRAVSSSNDMTLRVWDLEAGTEIRTLQGHGGWTLAVAILPDGRRAVSASSDQTLKLWDLESGSVLKTLVGHAREVTSVAVSRDGRRAISGSSDLTLRVWDLESGRELQTLTGHYGGVNAVVVTVDGRQAVSASDDETLKVWDLESDPGTRAAMGHNGGINAAVVTRDGRRVVSASWDRTLKVWDLETGTERGVLRGHTGEVTSVAVTADGRRAVSASRDKTLRVWDLSTGASVKTLPSDSVVLSLAITAGGRRAVSASSDESVTVWDLEAEREVGTLTGHTDAVLSVAMTTGGRYAVSASRDHTLKVWDLERGLAVRTLNGHDDWVTAVALTGDGRRAVSASSDGTVRLWSLETMAEPAVLTGHGGEVNAVAVTLDGRRAVSASRDETVKVWDLATGTCLATFFAEGELATCAIAPEGSLLVAADYLGRLHFLRLEGIS